MGDGTHRYAQYVGGDSFGPSAVARGRVLSAQDREFVSRQRGLRASWQAVADMLGMTAHDLRMQADPGYAPPDMLLRKAVLAPAEVRKAAIGKALEARVRGDGERRAPGLLREAVLLALAAGLERRTLINGAAGVMPTTSGSTLMDVQRRGWAVTVAARDKTRDRANIWALPPAGERAVDALLARDAADAEAGE